MARWAFRKTRRLARVDERVRLGVRRFQAWGLVSRITVRREGGALVSVVVLRVVASTAFIAVVV